VWGSVRLGVRGGREVEMVGGWIYQSDDFQESPKGEYDSEQHLGGFVGSVIEIGVVVVVVKLFGWMSMRLGSCATGCDSELLISY